MSEWIKAEESLPRNYQDIICVQEGAIYPATYFEGYWENQLGFGNVELDKVTHWMPTPSLPEDV